MLPFHICCSAIYLSIFVVLHSNTPNLLFRILPPRIHCSSFCHSGFATPCFTVPDLLFHIPCSGFLYVAPPFTVPDLLFRTLLFRISCSVFLFRVPSFRNLPQPVDTERNAIFLQISFTVKIKIIKIEIVLKGFSGNICKTHRKKSVPQSLF